MNTCPICTTNEEIAHKCTSQATKILVYDGSKQGETVGVLGFCFLALNLDSFHFSRTLNGSKTIMTTMGHLRASMVTRVIPERNTA